MHLALFMKPGGTVIQIKRNTPLVDNADTQFVINKTKDEEMLSKALKVRRGDATQEEIDDLVAFTIDNEGIEYAYWAMNEFRMMADGLIDESRDPAIVESLHSLVSFMAERKY